MELVHERIVKVEKVVTTVLEYIVSIAFFMIIMLTITLVFLRYFFGKTLLGGGGNELMEFLFIYTTSLGAAVSIGKREHIKIDYFLNKLRQPYRMAVDSLGQLCVAAINIVITYLSVNWITKAGNFESPVLRLPMWTAEMIIPIGCILVSLYSFLNVYIIIREGIREMNGIGPETGNESPAVSEINDNSEGDES